MNSRIVRVIQAAVFVLLSCGTHVLTAQTLPVERTLTVHEWGTFTSVAGSDGKAVEWAPLTWEILANDLPSFVERLSPAVTKGGLRATVRMETPVIYFYSPRELTLSVHVSFAKGLITEWYPHASGPQHNNGFDQAALYEKKAADGDISWNNVELEPRRVPEVSRDAGDNRYYAARETSSTPLLVRTEQGAQHEKFLFYRGVSEFAVPVSAKLTADNRLLVANRIKTSMPEIILFERRGDKVGYRVGGALRTTAVLDRPALTGSVESLCAELQEILMSRGLYPDEAHAMIDTWRSSWFEEGSRLIYILPSRFVDTVLPLTIQPAPATTVRVFVGRLEIITPATQKAVAAAFASNDEATLAKFGRFLEPIRKIIDEQKSTKESAREKIGRASGERPPVDGESTLAVQKRGPDPL